MDPQAFIDSGILELYVLDRLDPAERREVERYAADHPSVRQELNDLEVTLEEYALLRGQETPPPPEVLKRVMDTISRPTSAAPAAPAAATPPYREPGLAFWVLLGLLALAAIAAYFYYARAESRQAELLELREELQTLTADCASLRDAQDQTTRYLATVTDPATQDIVLAGTDNAPQSRAVVFYNPADGNALFSAANLPTPPQGKQYQLWAIDESGPRSLGVLDLQLAEDAVLELEFVPGAAAFAITLEDEGGKPAPDLTQLQVYGETSS